MGTAPVRGPRFRVVDAAMVRSSVASEVDAVDAWPGVEDDAHVEAWCAWLTEIWSSPPTRDAIRVASPSLAARLDAVEAGYRPRPSQARRMMLSLARYLARMRGRATPFGVFAGVAPLRFGDEASGSLEDAWEVSTRADSRWLADVIARLESCAEVRRRLPLVANNLAVVRGERVVVLWAPHAAVGGHSGSVRVSVRRTRGVQAVLASAQDPIPGGDLVGKLAAEMPRFSAADLEGVLARLLECGVLVSALRPASTVEDGLAHVLAQLDGIHAETIADVHALIAELREISVRLRTPVYVRTAEPIRVRMRALSDVVEQPMMTDLRFRTSLSLPRSVADEAASAASALVRATPHPLGDPRMRDYHARFIERYGIGALVEVDQLINPTAGLGLPAHYDREEDRTGLDPRISRRDEHLLVLAQQATLDGVTEVEVDDAFLDDLVTETGGGLARPLPHLELCAEVHAASEDDLNRGEFALAVRGVSRSGLALTGRFLGLLDEQDRARVISEYQRLPTAVDGALAAQLSFPPRHVRLGNVARSPWALPVVLSLGEHRECNAGLVHVDDLAVTADGDRLYVVSLSQRRVVEPVITNATARRAWPPVARLLVEIGRSGMASVSPFAWGAAACLPFLPRVRYGRSVLCPARWRIPVHALPAPGAAHREWSRALDALRDRLRLPLWVSVGEADRMMRLNLDEQMDRALLRDHLKRAAESGQSTTIAEAPTPADHGWSDGHVREIVVPLAATAPSTPVSPTVARVLHPRSPLVPMDAEHGLLPGQGVVSAQLYGDPDHVDAILACHLRRLLEELGQPMWWFLRYRDPHPHLRLRLHPEPGLWGSTIEALGAWASDLRRRGLAGELTLNTYRPEIARYGPGPAMDAAEMLFAADSAAALAQIGSLAVSPEVQPRALTAASMVDLAAAMTGGWAAGVRWFLDRRPARSNGQLAREQVRQAVRLANPSADHAALRALPDGESIARAWQARRQAAASYVAQLRDAPSAPPPATVLVSLLHLHHIRVLGIDPEAEQQTERIARAVALSWTSRSAHAAGGAR